MYKQTHPHMIQPGRDDFVKWGWKNQLTINSIQNPECCCYKLPNTHTK